MDFNALAEALPKQIEGVVEICDLGAYKALVVFNSKQRATELV